MGFTPFVSVVIPTYNRAQSTIAAIESVLAQTYSNVEIIVVDDGSIDGSSELIDRFIDGKRNSSEISYFFQSNQGPSVARNEGIKRARGEYVAFLDSDDVWLPEKLEWQVRALAQFKNECGACFTDAWHVDNSRVGISTFRLFGRHYAQPTGIDHDALKSLAKSFCGFWLSTLLVRTDISRKIGGFDPNISFAEDRDFYFRLSVATPLVYVDKLLVRCDRSTPHPSSTCRPWERVDVRLRGHQRMYEKWLRLGETVPTEVRKTILHDLRATHCAWANWYLENERYDEARQETSKAIKYGVSPKMTIKWALTWIAPIFAKQMSGRSRRYL